jgi:hypothetical protein
VFDLPRFAVVIGGASGPDVLENGITQVATLNLAVAGCQHATIFSLVMNKPSAAGGTRGQKSLPCRKLNTTGERKRIG